MNSLDIIPSSVAPEEIATGSSPNLNDSIALEAPPKALRSRQSVGAAFIAARKQSNPLLLASKNSNALKAAGFGRAISEMKKIEISVKGMDLEYKLEEEEDPDGPANPDADIEKEKSDGVSTEKETKDSERRRKRRKRKRLERANQENSIPINLLD